MSETILKVEDLKTSFMTSSGEVQAVRGVSFEVHKGEILGIVGESGSGKSVTSMSILRLLADTARIKNGKIEFEGTDLTKVSDKQMREIRGQKIAMVFQDPMSSLNPLIPVGKQVAEMIHVHHPEMKRDELQAATLELFREVRIPEAEKRLKSYPHEFSGGMRHGAGQPPRPADCGRAHHRPGCDHPAPDFETDALPAGGIRHQHHLYHP